MSLEQIIQHYRAELMRYEHQAEHAIRSAHAHMLSTVTAHMDALLKQYKDAPPDAAHWIYAGGKLGNAKQLVKSQVNQFGANAKAQVLTTQHKAVELGETSAYHQLSTVVPSHQRINTPTNAEKSNLVGTSHTDKPIDDLMDGFGDEASDRVGKALIAGVSIGQQPDTIDRAIMAALLISLSRALTIERTEEMSAYRSAWLLTMQQNEAQQWQWKSFPGACPFCQSMDGSVHDISEDMDSHPNCRCQMKLITIGA